MKLSRLTRGGQQKKFDRSGKDYRFGYRFLFHKYPYLFLFLPDFPKQKVLFLLLTDDSALNIYRLNLWKEDPS